MKVVFRIAFKNTGILPNSYRIVALKLIKEATRRSNQNLYEDFFGECAKSKVKSKAYTYSVFSYGIKKIESGYTMSVPHMTLTVASTDAGFISGLLSQIEQILTTEDPRDYFNVGVKSVKCEIIKQPVITSSTASFEVLSPVILNKREGDKTVGYLSPDDSEYESALKQSICNMFKNVYGYFIYPKDLVVKIHSHKTVYERNYSHTMIGMRGLISIHAAPFVLNTISDIGIGHRRNLGFGMLREVGSK